MIKKYQIIIFATLACFICDATWAARPTNKPTLYELHRDTLLPLQDAFGPALFATIWGFGASSFTYNVVVYSDITSALAWHEKVGCGVLGTVLGAGTLLWSYKSWKQWLQGAATNQQLLDEASTLLELAEQQLTTVNNENELPDEIIKTARLEHFAQLYHQFAWYKRELDRRSLLTSWEKWIKFSFTMSVISNRLHASDVSSIDTAIVLPVHIAQQTMHSCAASHHHSHSSHTDYHHHYDHHHHHNHESLPPITHVTTYNNNNVVRQAPVETVSSYTRPIIRQEPIAAPIPAHEPARNQEPRILRNFESNSREHFEEMMLIMP